MAIGNISEELKAYSDYLLNGETVPQNTTTTGDAVQVGGTQAELEVVAVAATDIGLADTKVLTLKLTGADTSDGSFTDLVTLNTTTASGATTITAGTELGRYVVKPSDDLYAKAVIITDDAAATGSVDVYLRRVCR
jgi:hypothetical protein